VLQTPAGFLFDEVDMTSIHPPHTAEARRFVPLATPDSATVNPHDTTLHRMVAAIQRTTEERGHCIDADLIAEGFTRAEIIEYAPEATRILAEMKADADTSALPRNDLLTLYGKQGQALYQKPRSDVFSCSNTLGLAIGGGVHSPIDAHQSQMDGWQARHDDFSDIMAGAPIIDVTSDTAPREADATPLENPAFLIRVDRDQHYLLEADDDFADRLSKPEIVRRYRNNSVILQETTLTDPLAAALRLIRDQIWWTGWLTRIELFSGFDRGGGKEFAPAWHLRGPRIRAAIDPNAVTLIADARQAGLDHLLTSAAEG
jgi:hypothetical protein